MPSPRRPAQERGVPPLLGAGDLAGCEFFGDFDEASRSELLGASSLRRLAAGAALFREGEACRALHLLLDGEVKMHKLSAEGKEQVVRRLKPGQIFGAAPLFTPDGAFPATAVALRRSLVLSVPKAELVRFLDREPRRYLRVLSFVSQHLEQMMRLAETVSLDRVPKRLADRLLELARAQGGPKPGQALRLEHSRSELAAELGTVREVLGRALARLQKQGVLKVEGRRVVLLRPEALSPDGRA